MEIVRPMTKVRSAWLLTAFLIMGLLAFYMMAPFRSSARVLLIVLVFPMLLFVLPAAMRSGLRNSAILLRTLSWQHGIWLLLFLSGLVFRLRDNNEINDNPVDGWAMYRLTLEMVVAFVLVVRLIDGRTPWLRALFQGLLGVLAVYVFVCFASVVWSVKPAWTLVKSAEYTLDLAVLAAVLVSVKSSEEYERFLNWTWALLGILLGTVWLGAIVDPADALEKGQVLGPLGYQLKGVSPALSSNSIGEFSAILGIVVLSRLLLHRGEQSDRGWYRLLLVGSLITLIFSQARSAIGGFLFGTVVLLFLSRRFLLAALLGLAGAVVFTLTDSAQYVWSFLLRGQQQQQFESLSSRVEWWQFAWQQFLQHPWTGYGAFAGGRFVVMAGLQLPSTPDLHSVYVETLVDTSLWGLIPLIMTLLAVWFYLLRSVRHARVSHSESCLAIELTAVVAVLSVKSVFNSNLISHPALPFLAVLGFAELMRRRQEFGDEAFGITAN
jgi:O-antigen ligase